MNTDKTGIIAFAFGTPSNIKANQVIGKISEEQARVLNAPLLTQSDVPIRQLSTVVKYVDEEKGEPPPTLRIARAAVKWAKQEGMTKLHVVAAKPHLWRALRDMRQSVLELDVDIIVCSCSKIDQYSKEFWFCSDSTQIRTRSKKEWNRREHILKILPFWFYKIIAG